METLTAVILALAAFAGGSLLGAVVWRLASRRGVEQLAAAAQARATAEVDAARAAASREVEERGRQVRAEAEAQAQARVREAEAAAQARVRETEAGLARDRARLVETEARIQQREQQLQAQAEAGDRRAEALERRDAKLREQEERARLAEERLAERQRALDARSAEIEQSAAARLAAAEARAKDIDEQAAARLAAAEARVAALAGISPEEARAQLLAKLDAALAAEQSARISRHQKETEARAKEIGIELVSRAIQRYAAEHTAETTVARFKLPDEEFKGRIIGKEGRNIKAFEQATGVDVIIDDGPLTIALSCFDGVRREIARRTLAVLLEDGRIHPARIEEVLARVQADIEEEIMRMGEDAALACEISGLHPQVLRLLGKLQFRTSYGQNVLKHSQEVAFLCGAMAADLGLDPRLGRRCGLLHDVGKALDHEQEGSHPQLGHEALKRYGESEIVANAALAHHEGFEVLSAYTVLAAAADAISAARPGARSANAESYIKRLQRLEEIACGFAGVQKAYCIQAGREVRVIINGHSLGDQELPKVAYSIARKIEDEVAFPGEIKVTVIRETRHFAVAR